jgi:hypothetical protein
MTIDPNTVRKKKRINVSYKKLGKTQAWGWAYHEDGRIEMDERVKGKKHAEILTHEILHVLFPNLSEKEVEAKAIVFVNTLWHEGYRRIDNENSIPMQDGSK